MPTPTETRDLLELVTGEAIASGQRFAQALDGSPIQNRIALFEVIPSLIAGFAEGSAALAADSYADSRAAVLVSSPFAVQTVIPDRTAKIYNAIAWASEPFGDDLMLVSSRLAELIQLEVARPFRDTIRFNRLQDPASVGWRRITRGGCKFCRALAARGAVYKKETALFAAHTNCHCAAEPVFEGQAIGPEASTMQYVASLKKRTPAQQAAMREWVDTY
jgi:hypothetical protein